MSDAGAVVSVNVSSEKGTIKKPVESIEIDDRGVVGDAHAGPWSRQVSLLAVERIEEFTRETGRETAPGEFAENITVRGLDLSNAAPLDRFRIGEVELEVTQIGKSCHGESCAIFREVGQCIMPTEGVFCRVVEGGRAAPGDQIEYLPKSLTLRIITLSDRAYSGDYEDRSGPALRKLLEEFLKGKRWHIAFEETLLPDDGGRLLDALMMARDAGVDVVFTTGGTGVGPRDIAPDVVASFCDKLIPGIMDHIRLKYGETNPNALLSRSVAGTAGTMLVYSLPGSVRAVEEYVTEIVKTLEHLLLTIHGIDPH